MALFTQRQVQKLSPVTESAQELEWGYSAFFVAKMAGYEAHGVQTLKQRPWEKSSVIMGFKNQQCNETGQILNARFEQETRVMEESKVERHQRPGNQVSCSSVQRLWASVGNTYGLNQSQLLPHHERVAVIRDLSVGIEDVVSVRIKECVGVVADLEAVFGMLISEARVDFSACKTGLRPRQWAFQSTVYKWKKVRMRRGDTKDDNGGLESKEDKAGHNSEAERE
ncbi:hypothetical protein B0H14DRAFT_2639482 [Mycena olivaceomarginata]|nr:hypothetical protein B0H14DRAFT_2639482 [Mycena olivaceomarginata]